MDDTAQVFLVIARNYHSWKGTLEVLLRRADVGFSFCDSAYDCLARIYSVKNIDSLCVIGDGEMLSLDSGKFVEFCGKKKIDCLIVNDGNLSAVKNYLNITEDQPTNEKCRISDQEIEALFNEKI